MFKERSNTLYILTHSHVRPSEFTEWNDLDDPPYRKNYKKLIRSGKIAIVLKTGLTTWYCGYRKKSDFPGKVLFVQPPIWHGTSFPNPLLKEAIKAFGYLLAGDKKNAAKQMIEYTQERPADLLYRLNGEHRSYNWEYLGWRGIDDSDIPLRALFWKIMNSFDRQDLILKNLNEEKQSFKELLEESRAPKTEEEFEILKEYYRVREKTFAEFMDTSRQTLDALYSVENELTHLIEESRVIRNLMPVKDDGSTPDDYQDVPNVLEAFTVDQVLKIMTDHRGFFHFEMFMKD